MKTNEETSKPKPEEEPVAPVEADACSAQERAPETPAPAPDETAVLKDQFLRLRADFDNYRKRIARDQIEVIKRANEDLIESLLPALDHFGSAESMMAQKAGAEAAPYLEGFRMVKNELLRVLETNGLKAIPALGEKFDANLHEALSTQPATETAPPETIVFEIAKGYTLHGRVIRASRVVVAESVHENEVVAEEKNEEPVAGEDAEQKAGEDAPPPEVKKPPFGSARSRFVE